ncbi:cAMP-dependent protein kinase catalytic subunit [Cimex lectularius]|uniref:CPR type cuticle protein n=1 Tax=Cimex lectularius TaxID=79782 RepID=A0A8I6RWB7_CIMLE|nr:cAMP-dependent protein kinase catalytic subunit [Cimex lectularius]
MIKFMILAVAVIGCCQAYPVTQEELAQYVARQQTAGSLPVGATARRQAYVLQPQAKAVYQPQPKDQVYQFQPKAQPQVYQVAGKQYYQPQAAEQQQQQYYQPQYYQPQPQSQGVKKLARPVVGQQVAQEPEDYDPNPQYQFGFDIKDDEFTNYQKRKEQREGDKISGSYSVVDSDGYIRTVTYTADPLEGFKADVVREPTDIKVKVPTPQLLHEQFPSQYGQQNLVARKQQTQQYLQASQPVQRPQVVLRPEHTQAYAGSQAQQFRQVAAYTGGQPFLDKSKLASVGYQQPSTVLYQTYQQ